VGLTGSSALCCGLAGLDFEYRLLCVCTSRIVDLIIFSASIFGDRDFPRRLQRHDEKNVSVTTLVPI